MSPPPAESAVPAPAHVGGRGSDLVLLHGLGNTWEVWKPVIPGLEARHRVIALTLPGHHGGPEYQGPGDATVAGLADQVIAMLKSQGITQAHVAGNSLATERFQNQLGLVAERLKRPLDEVRKEARVGMHEIASTQGRILRRGQLPDHPGARRLRHAGAEALPRGHDHPKAPPVVRPDRAEPRQRRHLARDDRAPRRRPLGHQRHSSGPTATYRYHRRYRITEGSEEVQMRRAAQYLLGFAGKKATK